MRRCHGGSETTDQPPPILTRLGESWTCLLTMMTATYRNCIQGAHGLHNDAGLTETWDMLDSHGVNCGTGYYTSYRHIPTGSCEA